MPATHPSAPNTDKPKWHEKWRNGIRAAETAIVIGFWVGGIAALDQPTIASLLFVGGAIVASISIFAEPTRSLIQKFLWTAIVDLIFVFSAVFVVFHQIKDVADNASAQLIQVERTSGSRIEFTDIEPFYPPNANSSDPFMFKFNYKNTGVLAAEMPNFRSVVLLPATWTKHSTEADFSSSEDEAMEPIIKQSQENPFSDSGNQIQPGDTNFFEMGPKVSKDVYVKLQNDQYQIGFGFVLKYTDAATPPGYANYTYFCAYLINDGTGGWQYCHSYNKVFVAKN